MARNSFKPVSHRFPEKLGGQLHSKPLTLSTHVPPFWQGLLSHSSLKYVTVHRYHKSVKYDRLGEYSAENDCLGWHWLTFRHPSTDVVKTSLNVIASSPSQDYTHPDDHNVPTYDMTPGFKSFTVFTDILSNTLNRERLMTPKILNTKPDDNYVIITPLTL